MTTVRIEGWFPNTTAYPSFNSALLDREVYKYTVKDLELPFLRFIPLQRYAGSFWKPIPVQAVINVNPNTITTGLPVPFFIEENKAKKLKRLLKKIPSPTIL